MREDFARQGVSHLEAVELEQGPSPGHGPIPILYGQLDGAGVPMVARELAGRKGKQPDGTAKTREVKLSAVFAQTRCDEKGRAERDYASTTCVGSFESAQALGRRVREEARLTPWLSASTRISNTYSPSRGRILPAVLGMKTLPKGWKKAGLFQGQGRKIHCNRQGPHQRDFRGDPERSCGFRTHEVMQTALYQKVREAPRTR